MTIGPPADGTTRLGRQVKHERLSRLRTQLEWATVAKRNGATASRQDRGRAPDAPAGREPPAGANSVSSSNGPRRTSGGAPYGLRACDFARADLEAMGRRRGAGRRRATSDRTILNRGIERLA